MMTMEGWQEVSLGEIVVVQGGFAFKSSDFEDGGIPIVRMSDLVNGNLDLSGASCITANKLKKLSYFELHTGDFLIGMSGSIDNYAIVREQDIPAYLNQRVGRFCLLEINLADYNFITQIARSDLYRRHVQLLAAGAAQLNISPSQIESFRFDLPPKPEQTKIAEILSTVDRAIEQTEALIAKQQRIKTGLMQDLLTRGIDEHGNIRTEQTHEFKDSQLGRIPVEWEVESLGRVIGSILSGWSPTCDSLPATDGEWAILKTTAVVWQGYEQSENKRLPFNLHGIPSIEVQPDDILITRKGPVERVGVVVHVNKTRSKLMIPDTVYKTRLLDASKVIPAFLPYALGCAKVQSDWFQKKIGLADAQVNLNHSILRTTLFPQPDVEEQNRIVTFVSGISDKFLSELAILEKQKKLKTALMQDLLTGKKRVTPLLNKTEVMS